MAAGTQDSSPSSSSPLGAALTWCILVAEDEPHLRFLIRRTLESRGYKVLEAANGEIVLRVCKEHPGTIDLLLTDVKLPIRGGLELALEAISIRRDLRILFMSGGPADARMKESGIPFIAKPFALKNLLTAIERILTT